MKTHRAGGGLMLWTAAFLLAAASPAAGAAGPEATHVDVFTSGRDGYAMYRIPAIETAPDGSLLAFAEARKYGGGDPGFHDNDIDLVFRRSTDGGRTWSPMRVLEDPGEKWSAANPATVVDRTNGRVWVLYLRSRPGRSTVTSRPGTDDMMTLARSSSDNGQTWSDPVDLSRTARDYDDPAWRSSVVGPGGAIQDRKGRLIAPVWKYPFANFTIFSDDHGATWRRGSLVPGLDGDESQLVELADGSILMDSRQRKEPHRWLSVSTDGGKTWGKPRPGETVTRCACAIERYSFPPGGGKPGCILWTGPRGPGRKTLVVRSSTDEGRTFGGERVISQEKAAYSDMTVLEDGRVGVLWERGGYRFITLTLLTVGEKEKAPSAPGAAGGWAADAVFYQIFPERFRNGDPSNDPDHASLEFPDVVPDSWTVSPWTGDWYARAAWERALGDRFYDDGVFHRRYGGDLQGVVDRLDYLQDLGINTIYFNPIFYARSLHKYDGNTFHHVDPYFGPDPKGDFALMARESSDPATWHWTRADRLFLDLVRKAHSRGIRIILDGVFNHTGRDFFAFADLRKNQENSRYKDWYIVERFDDPKTPKNEFRYKGWWGVDTLPEFADTPGGKDLHPGPKKYILDATRRWMDPDGNGDPSDGIDGWRLDVANEVPIAFWADWNAHVRRLNPAAYTVTEIWRDASEFLRRGGFSATMNYHGFAFPVKGFLIDGRLSATGFVEQLEARRKEYPESVQRELQNLIDSHDTDRLASMIVNAGRQKYAQPERFDYDVGGRVSPRHTDKYDVRKPNARERRIQRLVALFQLVYVGAPMIYYGTEAGMWGADDPDDRMPMVWPDLEYEPQKADPLGRPRTPDPVVFDRKLFRYYKSIIHLRGRHEALRRGDIHFLGAGDEAATLAFARSSARETLLVVINRSDGVQRVVVPRRLAPLAANARWTPILVSTGVPSGVSVSSSAAAIEVQVPGLSGVVLQPAGDER